MRTLFMVMEDYNLLHYSQHQLITTEPTLITRPNLVFLAPTKKFLRSPILKCKIPLASLIPITDCHQFASLPLLLINLRSSTLLVNHSLLAQSGHQHLLFINVARQSVHVISPSSSSVSACIHHQRVCIIL